MYEAVTFDYKITNDGTIAVALMNSDWTLHYSYYMFDAKGETQDYAGVTTEVRTDGYVMVTFNIAELTEGTSTKPEMLGLLRVRGQSSTATGYIDNIQFKEKA